ncbi:MAG: peptidylprolyl isomerase [Desulfobacterales bacterium]|nr:peptidylprolyl isomerase [Desulfobacterales bacterium]
MAIVANGLFVQVNYRGTLEGGHVFDTSEGQAPIEVLIGEGQLIKGFEDALIGMTENEKKTITLAPEEAYGLRDESQQHIVPRSVVPAEFIPLVDQTVGLTTPDGRQIPATIIEVTDEQITLDLNHPLAGESLTFEIEVVGITKAPTQPPVGCGCGSSNPATGGCGCDGDCSSDCGC